MLVFITSCIASCLVFSYSVVLYSQQPWSVAMTIMQRFDSEEAHYSLSSSLSSFFFIFFSFFFCSFFLFLLFLVILMCTTCTPICLVNCTTAILSAVVTELGSVHTFVLSLYLWTIHYVMPEIHVDLVLPPAHSVHHRSSADYSCARNSTDMLKTLAQDMISLCSFSIGSLLWWSECFGLYRKEAISTKLCSLLFTFLLWTACRLCHSCLWQGRPLAFSHACNLPVECVICCLWHIVDHFRMTLN